MENKTRLLDPFYLILEDFSLAKRLVPLGVKTLQLRIKDKEKTYLHKTIRQVKSLCEMHNCQLILNDYWQIALEEGCDFLHLGQEDLRSADVHKLKKANIKLGISTHSLEELENALRFDPDYVALGPIYPTLLKKMPWPAQGIDKLAQWNAQIKDLPLVAIGGLDIPKGIKALNNGADSVAVVTNVTLAENPELCVENWLRATENWR